MAPGVSARGSTTAVAWVATLLISALPQIVLQELLGIQAPWMPWLIVGVAIVLWLLSRVLDLLAPLERYLAVMVAVSAVVAVVPLIFQSEIWRTLVPPTSQPMTVLVAERAVLALIAIGLLVVAFVLGARRREMYLQVGDLNGPTTQRRRGGGYYGWRVAGPIAIVGIVILMLWFLWPRLPDQIDWGAAMPLIGIAAVAALLNAFWEEIAFRSVPLAMLQRAVGPSAGVLMLAVYFGAGHFYGGVPSEWMGLIAASLIGLLFGRAMIETRGLAWPLILHFTGDFVIFSVLAVTSL